MNHERRVIPLPTQGFRLGRVAGVQIQLDWSVLIVFALVAFNLGAGVLPYWHPEWSARVVWGTALGAALLFFGSVLAHELSHALVARTQGIRVPTITLFLFGGMTHMQSEPRSPKSEFWIAIVGPITSLAIGAAATAAALAMSDSLAALAGAPMTEVATRRALSDMGPLATLLLWLGPVNVMLGLFNLIPGFPLDGGRVLRALLWWTTDDLLKATRWAALSGRVVAWGLIAYGVLYVFAGMLGQGLWLVLIGWFLSNAASMSYQQLITRRLLEDVPISQVMWKTPHRIAPSLTLDRFVQDHLLASDQAAFPVESEEGRMMGMITLHDVRRVPRSEWPQRTVQSAMTPAPELTTLPPDADADAALEVLANRDVDQVPIVRDHHLEGLVRRRDLVRWMSVQSERPSWG